MRLFLLVFFIFFSPRHINNIAFGSTNAEKSKILEEFRNKLMNEAEIKQELVKQKVLTKEDLDVLNSEKLDSDMRKNREELLDIMNMELLSPSTSKDDKLEKEKEEKKKKLEEERLRKEEEEKKKEEEKRKKEEEKKRIMEEKFLTEEEKKKKQEEKEEKEEKETTTTARQRRSSEKTAGGSKRLSKKEIEENEKKQRELEELEREAREKEEAERIAEEARLALEAEAAAKEKSEMEAQTGSILMKEYNIVDTGVNVEYLYSRDYEDLLKNKISIKKTNVNLENALPKVLTIPKRLDNFATSDIPPEILSYTRSEENRHIPIVLRNEDLFAISRQAVFENNLALLRSIIEKIQDPDFLVDNRYTLLSLSINNKRFDLVKFLVFNGANVNRRDLEGNSPLHSAILTRDRRIIDFLIKNGAELDLQNANGETPLMLATKTSQADLAIYIIRLGADLAIKNNDGLNILDIANKTKNRNLAKIIGDVMRSTDK